MVDYDENEYAAELKEKSICRFCLTQDDALTNIYSVKNNANSQVTLSMQIMACVSIEVCRKTTIFRLVCFHWSCQTNSAYFEAIWSRIQDQKVFKLFEKKKY